MSEPASIANCNPGPIYQNHVGAHFGEVPFGTKRMRNSLKGLRTLMQIAEASESARGDNAHDRGPGEKRCAARSIIATARIIESLQPGLDFGTGHERINYRGNRYSGAYHIDLCDFLSNYGAVRRNSINLFCKLMGLPGKYTIAGEDVEYLFRQGRQKEINQYCMTDVLQTYLLFLRVELLRGKLDRSAYQEGVTAAREDLTQRASSAGSDNFLLDFLQRWNQSEA